MVGLLVRPVFLVLPCVVDDGMSVNWLRCVSCAVSVNLVRVWVLVVVLVVLAVPGASPHPLRHHLLLSPPCVAVWLAAA